MAIDRRSLVRRHNPVLRSYDPFLSSIVRQWRIRLYRGYHRPTESSFQYTWHNAPLHHVTMGIPFLSGTRRLLSR